MPMQIAAKKLQFEFKMYENENIWGPLFYTLSSLFLFESPFHSKPNRFRWLNANIANLTRNNNYCCNLLMATLYQFIKESEVMTTIKSVNRFASFKLLTFKTFYFKLAWIIAHSKELWGFIFFEWLWRSVYFFNLLSSFLISFCYSRSHKA